jgi:serine/threonine-protein kinase
MADVFLAEDNVLGRRVALKVLYPQFAEDQVFVARFKQEAQAAAALSHPNIVSIFDWGSENSTYYIVMEYVEGENLKSIIKKEGGLLPAKVIEIGKQVATALDFAHQHNIIHRDIKPHNIVLTNEGTVKVTDFGIARAGASTMTQTGTILGSAHYFSPEQARGEEVDKRSDIYSLGVVLYEMATGQLPFGGENPVAVAIKHVHEAPIPPRQINPEIPVSLEAIILKAMAKEPENRYQDAQELIEDLEKATEGLPVRAESSYLDDTYVLPTTPPTEAEKVAAPLPQRGRVKKFLAWFLLFLLSIAIAGSGGYALYKALQPPPIPKVRVPNLVGKTIEEAAQILASRKLKLVEAGKKYSNRFPPGSIISQTPRAGKLLKEGSKVRVVVSLGREMVNVADVKGERESKAVAILTELGLKWKESTYEFNDDIPLGRVISQTPSAGERVAKGSSFTLVISKGPNKIEVPYVKGKTEAEARRILQNKGFAVDKAEDFSDTVDKGLVISQSPEAGQVVRSGITVTIVVSKGPEMVTVPDVIYKTEEEAKTELETIGLTVQVNYLPPSPMSGKVVAQEPSGGERVKKGSTVTIHVVR